MACFAHFTWLRLQPLPVRQLYDTVSLTASCMSLESDTECSLEKEEQPDSFLLHSNPSSAMGIIMYVLSNSRSTSVFRVSRLDLVSCPYRYAIFEDYGPIIFVRSDLPGYLVTATPPFLSCVTVGIFNSTSFVLIYLVASLFDEVRATVRALVTYWRMKREDIDSNITKYQSSVRTRKILLMAVINVPLAVYGVCIQIINVLRYEWDTPISLAKNIASLQVVLVNARSELDTTSSFDAGGATRTAIFMPLLAFYMFAWFGFGEEVRKAYVEALLKLGHLIGVVFRAYWQLVCLLPSSWYTTALRKDNPQHSFADALPLGLPRAPQITPYTSSVLPDDSTELPPGHAMLPPPYSVGNRIDVKRQGKVPSREPERRLSIHKSRLAALNGSNSIPSVSDIPLCRLSHHKPRFAPLASPNFPAITTSGAFGSTPPLKRTANNIRGQERFSSRSHARRLLYHKPAFVPLTPANTNSAVPTALGPPSGDSEGHGRQEECSITSKGYCERHRHSASLSSTSTSTAPPSLSTPSAATPLYRDSNSFLNHVPSCTHERSV
jgi:Pheromone A receptor